MIYIMSNEIGNINKNMDKYIKIILKMYLQKSIISARLCFVRVSSRLGIVWIKYRFVSVSFG